MNESILIASFKYITKKHNYLVSLSYRINQVLSSIKYTDEILSNSIKRKDFQVTRSIIYFNENKTFLNNLLLSSNSFSYVDKYKIIKLLISFGANSYDEILLSASKQGHNKIIKLVLVSGADVHVNNDAPLRYACLKNQVRSVKLLIKHGADIHAENDEALIYACKYGNLKVVKILLAYGAKIHTRYDRVLKIACKSNNVKIVRLLLKSGATVSNDILATINCSREIVNLLLKAGANVHADNEKILRKACECNDIDLFKLAVKFGADIHVNDDLPLIIAADTNNIRIAKLLIHLGANVSANDNEPLITAAKYQHINIIKLLIDAGADPYEALLKSKNIFTKKIIKLLSNYNRTTDVINSN